MSNRMQGHALVGEGAPFTSGGVQVLRMWGGAFGVGHAKCTCGQLSPLLESANKRKRWHREHKEELRKESRK